MTDDAAKLAAQISRWLRSGRLQSPDGAFCAWRDAASDELAFEFPEITGYALTWLAPDGGGEAEGIENGHRAASWLVNQLRSGHRSARKGYDNGAVYTFDLGMIAAGLISFGRSTDTPVYVDQGAHAARELGARLRETGELAAIAPDGPPSVRASEWSTVGRVHLTKCAQALLLIDDAAAATQLCELALAEQHEQGWFPTQPGDRIMLHPVLYAVEGLWITGTASGDSRLLEAASRAARWVWRHQLPSGGLPRSVNGSQPEVEQLDVTTQAIRAAALLELDCPGLPSAVRRVMSVARSDGDWGQALVYQPGAEGNGHLNAWVSMFGEQALRAVAQGPQALSWNTLV